MCRVADCVIAAFLITAGYIDWRTKQISIFLLSFMSVMIILFRMTIIQDSIWRTLGGIIIGAFFFVVSRCSSEAIGYGDSWLIMLLGIYLGGMTLLEIVLVASFLTSLFSIIFCIKNGWSRKRTIPFVPFLAISYMGVIFL